MNNLEQYLFPRMRRVDQIHFVGIGGVGMSGIAEVLHNEGYKITGSDISENKFVQRLRKLGIHIYIGHHADNVAGANVVVCSSAVDSNNPEIARAHEQLIPVIPRAAMLAELMRFRYGIAIAGTHGKTTTTSLTSSLLAEGGLDPSFVIGGKLNSCDSNAQLGKSAYLVAEADESDASFLHLKPMMAVVTNIDADHMETYNNDFNALKKTFIEFLHHLPFYGLAVVCIDDEEVRSILPEIERPIITYGFSEGAHYQAQDWTQQELLSEFTVSRPAPYQPLKVKFMWPGRHNVLNALAAIAIATELGVKDEAILQGLLKFAGVGRRFQVLGKRQFRHGAATIIDDYGHHPQEIIPTIDTVRRVWPSKRLIHVFQPHRYSRTQSLFNEFVTALSLNDELLLLDIYAAGEQAVPGISSQRLLEQIKLTLPNAQLANDINLQQKLNEIVKDGDIILMQGAGNIGQLALNLMQTMRESAA